ncbi:MAG: hypothetical protein GY943_28080, partial [Chloroflexi bacterium]|nr:hypothetical protein [Chloroflexota bacterium]
MTQNKHQTLRQTISNTHNRDELIILMHDLDIDHEQIAGDTKDAKIVELLRYCERKDRLADLERYLQQLQTGSVRRNQLHLLPPRPDHFTGREDEIADLTAHLLPGQKVTLWAAGGMGKTAIAIETVHRLQTSGELRQRFPDGVIFYTFYGRPSNEALYEQITRTFDPNATQFTFDNTRGHLAGKKLLLIYDGAEDADDLSRALQLQGQNGLLITTRDRRSRGGKRIEVGLLPLAIATQMLKAWSQDSVDDVMAAAICDEIGRYALAVRIAGFYLDESGESPAAYLAALKATPIKELSHGSKQQDSAEILLKRTVAKLDTHTQTALAIMGQLAYLPFTADPLAAVLDP